MKSSVLVSLFPILFVMFMLADIQKAEAADVHLSIGGGNRGTVYREYRTSDQAYSTWYPQGGTSYGYTDGYYDNSYRSTYGYTTPYVYTTPSVQFGTWYGDGYRSHTGSYGGNRGGYSGGYRSGHSSGGGRR